MPNVTLGGGGRQGTSALMERLIPPVIVEVNRAFGGGEGVFGSHREGEVLMALTLPVDTHGTDSLWKES